MIGPGEKPPWPTTRLFARSCIFSNPAIRFSSPAFSIAPG